MVQILNSKNGDFNKQLNSLLADKLENSPEINAVVADIIDNIKTGGDAAILEYTNKFDRRNVSNIESLQICETAIEAAYHQVDQNLIDALELAAKRIYSYHEKQVPADQEYVDEDGVTLGYKWTAVDSAGLYVPGGLASYPSSVLMNAIPAKVAGVKRIVMVVPAPDGKLSPLVLAAAKIAGITEIYTIGGAQAIAALAYGTDTISPVNVIVGPGNAYVTAAKKQVFGTVGIDMLAGPSEILVVADNTSNPRWIAADLLSQAEHDEAARSVLITDDEQFAGKVTAEIENILVDLPRKEIASKSWNDNGIIIIVNSLENDAADIINNIATEHLELSLDNPHPLMDKVRNAGAIFVGKYTSEAIGDYIAGPSHVLPTASTAKFSSGISVFTYLKRSSIIECSKESFEKLAQPTIDLATAEGLDAHALSISVRQEK